MATNIQEFMEKKDGNDIFFIWLADSVAEKIGDVVRESLRDISNNFRIFDNVGSCYDFINNINSSKGNFRIIVMIDEQFGEKLVADIHDFEQVSAIYAFRSYPVTDKVVTSKEPTKRIVPNFYENKRYHKVTQ